MARMLFRQDILEGIRAGEVTLAFRRWMRPRMRVGTRLRTKVGVVEIVAVDEVKVRSVTDADARAAGAPDRKTLLAGLANRSRDPLYRVRLRFAGADPRVALRQEARLDADELAALRTTLARMDARSRRAPWTMQVLELIAAQPATRAPDLAAQLCRETLPFKADVRRLKELGLTESLEVGYRLSPRGRAFLDAR